MLSDGDKFTVVGAKEANSKKPETEDFEVETKQDVEYLKAVLAIHAALERKIKVFIDALLLLISIQCCTCCPVSVYCVAVHNLSYANNMKRHYYIGKHIKWHYLG